MELGAVTELDKRNTVMSKNFDDDVMSAYCDIIAFFQFMANLQPSRSRIPDAWSTKLTSSLTITFSLTKTENSTN